MIPVKPKAQEGQESAPSKKKLRILRRPKHLKRWIVLIVIVLVIAGLAGKFLLGGGQLGPAELTYTEEQVSSRTIIKSLTDSGTLQPANSYTVTTLIEGEVLSADFEEGDIVERDTVLYQIDSSDATTNIEKAQISLNQARRSYNSTVDTQYVKATFYVGQSAVVTLDGSFETLSGTVKSISGSNIVGTGNTITRNVTISVTNPGGLSNTQAAAASINGIGSAGNGTFTYQSESIVTASAGGTVTAIHVPEGGAVSKNQTLITLGGEDLENQIQNASDSLRNAELSMENTQEQLENYIITSPISGTVIDKGYKAGDTVEAARPSAPFTT